MLLLVCVTKIDNIVVLLHTGIVNGITIKQKKSKAIDLRFYWCG
jgi:hypothetical protein